MSKHRNKTKGHAGHVQEAKCDIPDIKDNATITEKKDILMHIYKYQMEQVMFRREREFRVFTWSSTIFLALMAVLLVTRKDENVVWQPLGVYGKTIVTFALIYLIWFSIRWQNRERELGYRHAKVITGISKILHFFDKGYFGDDKDFVLFSDKHWQEWGNTEVFSSKKIFSGKSYHRDLVARFLGYNDGVAFRGLGFHKDCNFPIYFTVTVKHHISILGPPAVGKMTVAKYLSKQVNYPVFDNAKTVDIALLLHEYNSSKYRSFRDELRFLFYREAATNSHIRGLISTNCLRDPKNWEYFTSVEVMLRQHGWSTIYFLLTADKNVLIERAASADRISKMSLSSREAIESWFATSPFHSQPQDHLCYSINTTKMTVDKVAEEIVKTLNLFHQEK